MPHRVLFPKLVEMPVEFFGGEVKMLVQKSAQVGGAVRGMGDQFHPVASGDDHALFDSRMGREVAASIGQAGLGYREALAHF